MDDTRKPRELSVRKNDVRPSDDWKPPSALGDPLPQDGYVFRWIRTDILGQPDPSNVSNKMREGWEPVKAEDHPELAMFAIDQGKFKGGVEQGGLILMKMSERKDQQRNEYYRRQALGQMESVDNNFLSEQDSRLPTLYRERKTKVSFGNGT